VKSKYQDHWVSHPVPDLDTLGEYLYLRVPSICKGGNYSTYKEFYLCDYLQTEEKKEEGMRG
jgi:hypothetical protein